MVLECDVLVVGAGVSGLVSALKLSKEGLKVIVIEKTKKIGQHTKTKIDVTESGGVEEIAKELKLSFLGSSHISKWFSQNNSFTYKSKEKDLFVKRGPANDSFESIAYKNALKQGVTFLFNAAPKKFIFENNILTTAIINQAGKTKEIQAKYFIGADGTDSKSVSLAGISQATSSGVEIAGYGITGTNFDMPESTTHVFFDSIHAPGGYFFIAKTKNGLGVASVVVNKARIKKNIKKYYSAFVNANKVLKKFLKKPRIVNEFYGSCRTFPLKKHVKNNFLVVGDAARVMDPIFAYGVRPAIISGYSAAETIIDAFREGKTGLGDYEKQISGLVGGKLDFFARKAYDKLGNPDFDFLVGCASYLQEKNKLDDAFDNPFGCMHLFIKHFLKSPARSAKLIFRALF